MALRFSTTADGAGIWGVYGRFSMLGLTSKGVPPQGVMARGDLAARPTPPPAKPRFRLNPPHQALTPKARPLTIKNRAVSRASALMFSVWNRHEGATRLLLDAGANIEVVDSQGITSLMKAAWQGACGITRMLLERGADPQQITSYGWSALHSACHGNCEVCCDLLLACGASPLAETQGRWLPLHEATQMGASVGVIGALLDAAPLTIKMECHGNRTPLALNLEFKGGVDVLKLLLSRGSNPNERGTRQPFDTPLSLAVKYAHPTAIRPLLEAGADPEALVKGLNPLQAALRMGVTDVILELLFA